VCQEHIGNRPIRGFCLVFYPPTPLPKVTYFAPPNQLPPLEEPERKVDQRDTTTPAPICSDQSQPSSCDEADGLQLAVLEEVVATDETRPLPHYWVSEQPQHSELDEGEVARLAVLAEAVGTHCHALLWKHT